MQQDSDLFELNYMRKKWEGRGTWIKNPLLGMFIAFALAFGVANLPNQGAILMLLIGGTTLISVLVFVFVRWRKLRMLDKKIRNY